jgi:hypothetical protein
MPPPVPLAPPLDDPPSIDAPPHSALSIIVSTAAFFMTGFEPPDCCPLWMTPVSHVVLLPVPADSPPHPVLVQNPPPRNMDLLLDAPEFPVLMLVVELELTPPGVKPESNELGANADFFPPPPAEARLQGRRQRSGKGASPLPRRSRNRSAPSFC